MEAQDNPNAIHFLNDLLELSPGDGRPYALLAQAYFETGQFEEARATLQAGWELNEGSLDFYLTAGKLYEGMNLPDQALAAYQAALALDPQSSPALEGIERLSVDPDE
jgi:cytochrome c-type biogenesis protein CcmH/NrfG